MLARIVLTLASFIAFFFLLVHPTHAETIVQDVGVNARAPWTDSGIDVLTNDSITLKSGFFLNQIYYDPNKPPVSPNGLADCIAGPTFVAPGLTCYSLILRIGNDAPFHVGFNTQDVTFTPSSSGRLYLGFNDEINFFFDNSGNFGFTMVINRTVTPTPTSTPVSSKTPLIFIPGIGGSELKTVDAVNWSQPDGHGGTFTHTYPAGEKVWVNESEARAVGEDDYFDILRMKSDGQTSEANLALTGNVYSGAYQGAINFFTANGYTLGTDFFVFPYDWRKDLSQTTSSLDQKIADIKNQTHAEKVDIVAHSMGGLVARNYIADAGRALNVRKLIELGTPHLGAVEFLKFLQYGGCFTKPGVPTQPICIGLSVSEVKDVIQNMIGGFELAPSQAYFTFYFGGDATHPYPFADLRDIDNNGVTGALNYSQIKTLLTNLGHNTGLFSPSETFHAIDNNLSTTNGVDLTLIAGSGTATLGQIIEKYAVNLLGVQIPKKDEVMINGDDTVPLFSASLDDPGKNHSLLGTAKIYYTKQKHGNLPTAGPALDLVKNILTSDTQLPTGVSSQPYSFSGTGLSVHSPVAMHVYDALGNHTGPIADGFEENIPGSSYETLDDAKFIYLSENGQYTIKFEATDLGQFDFKIRDFTNDHNDKTIIYQDVPLTSITKAQAAFDTSNLTTPPQIALDSNGDGITDTNVAATAVLTGAAAADQPPPVSSYTLSNSSQNGWFKTDVTVTLSATDEASGSGVLKTEYSIDNGAFQGYTTPFTISKEGTTSVKITSTDVAGNQEFPQSIDIKIDKTPPEAKANFNLQTQTIEVTGTDTLSSVTVSENPAGQMNLTDLAGNQTKLTVDATSPPRKDKIIFKTLQYGNNNAISLPANELDAILKTQPKTGQITGFTQKVTIPDQTLSGSFDPKTNTTTITIGRKKQTQTTVTQPGMTFLQLLTNTGQLEAKY